MKKTKIVCTIGPASGDVETLKELMKAGMNVARINFSHGSYPEQEKYINAVKQARKELQIILGGYNDYSNNYRLCFGSLLRSTDYRIALNHYVRQ